MWKLRQAGFKIVNFVHDEFVFEVEGSELAEAARESSRLMIEGMRQVLPDVVVGTEAAAMLRWSKAAKPAYNDKGDLQVWVPEATRVNQETSKE